MSPLSPAQPAPGGCPASRPSLARCPSPAAMVAGLGPSCCPQQWEIQQGNLRDRWCCLHRVPLAAAAAAARESIPVPRRGPQRAQLSARGAGLGASWAPHISPAEDT